MNVVQHQILSLDFWQDTVSYEGKNFPSGTIGCDALNIPATLIEQITELCGSLNLFMGAMQLGMVNAELFTSARESALQIVHKLKDIPPFSYLEEKRITEHIQKVFSDEYLEKAITYTKSLASGNLMNALDPQYQKALTLFAGCPCAGAFGLFSGTVPGYYAPVCGVAQYRRTGTVALRICCFLWGLFSPVIPACRKRMEAGCP